MKNNSRNLYYIFIPILLVFLSCEEDQTTDDTITSNSELNSKLGVWEGVGEQPGISWTIRITLNADEQRIEYPSIQCGGILQLLEEKEGYLLFRETITQNTVCADQGFIELVETTATSMDYNYYWPNSENQLGELGATGAVNKVN